MADKLKPLLKRIDEICKPIFKLGGEKGVKAKDFEKHYNKGPLSELAFDLFSCLYESKRQLEDLNRHVVKAASTLKEQDRRIHELDSSLEDKEHAEHSAINNIMAEVKKNGDHIVQIKAMIEENEGKLVTEAQKVSTYAEALQKTNGVNKEKSTIQHANVAKRVVSELKATDRKKNLVLYGVSGTYKDSGRIDYNDDIEDILIGTGFPGLQLDSVELLKPVLHEIPDDTEGESLITCTVRIQLPNEAIASRILKNASRLKDSRLHYNVFIAPDRTPEELKARARLVKQLKLKIKQEPTTKWVIRNDGVVSAGEWKTRPVP